MSHLDFGAKEVNVIRCRERTCSRHEVTTVESAPLSGFFAAPVLDASGRAHVAFFDEAIEGLVLVSCRSIDCHDRVRQVVDPTPLAGQHVALARGPAGLAIAYHDGSVRNLRLVRCAELTCATPPEAGPPGRGVAAAQGSRGPLVVYRANPRAGVQILRCLDASCHRADSTAADDVASLTGGPDVATGWMGSPLVVFQDLAAEDLRLTRCPQRCAYLEGATVADAGSIGHRPRIVATAERLGVVHRDETTRRIELIVCPTSECADPSRIPVAPTDGAGGAVALAEAEGELIVAYHDDRSGRLRLRTCTLDGCGDAATRRTESSNCSSVSSRAPSPSSSRCPPVPATRASLGTAGGSTSSTASVRGPCTASAMPPVATSSSRCCR